MISYDPTLLEVTSNFFVLCTNMKVYLYNYSLRMDLNMNIHEEKGSVAFFQCHNRSKVTYAEFVHASNRVRTCLKSS